MSSTSTLSAARMIQEDDAQHERNVEQAKIALRLAASALVASTYSQYSALASAVAFLLLKHYRLPCSARAGWMAIKSAAPDGTVVQPPFPHLWVETSGLVTDLTFCPLAPARRLMILGESIGRSQAPSAGITPAQETVPVYSMTPPASLAGVPTKLLENLPRLQAAAENMAHFVASLPPDSKKAVETIVDAAIRGDMKVQVPMMMERVSETDDRAPSAQA